MKCPKCGYNSFESYDTCKKCSNDLVGYKETYGIKPIVLPLEVRTRMAEALMAETAMNEQAPVSGNEPVDMFSFDAPPADATATFAADPFNFDDEPAAGAQAGGTFSFDAVPAAAQAKAEEDTFADLLESTSHKDSTVSAPGESTLSDFSWDDTPSPIAAESVKPADDDFNSLFGDMDDLTKK